MLTEQSRALAEKMREGKGDPDSWHLVHHLEEVVKNDADRAIVEQILAVNGDIEQRILNHAGLLRDGDIPLSFTNFLGHYRQLKVAFESVDKENAIPPDITAKQFESYPRQFDTDVQSGYEALQAERTALGL